MKTAAEIRSSFIDFFKDKNHTFVKSAPVAPQDDPTLLFTNAGMNQFKALFLGDNKNNLKRAANSQKCMRVSGKHNDLEEVGVDHHHHTFFEMLGNWSFGDYYKEEAIQWAWELVTDIWNLPVDKLYATVYTEDDEAEEIWKRVTNIPREHITRHGAKDNFWEMGETGPCGPCTEIHVDTGEGTCINEGKEGHICGVNADECGRYVEIWNLVFMQYNRQKDGSLLDLPAKHVDTGMGLERIVRIIQGAKSNYETDLFRPIIGHLEELSGCKYEFGSKGIPFRVIADHMRALVFSITDGVSPSNDGRGYVLRRLLRRAYRYGRDLGFTEPFMYKLVPTLIQMMKDAYPEIAEREEFITSLIKSEEQRFDQTLETGIERFNQIADQCKEQGVKVITGSDLFALYGTYGFPVDLVRLMAQEVGLEIDEAGFEKEMAAEKQKNRDLKNATSDEGLSADGWTTASDIQGTEFVGYSDLKAQVEVTKFKIVESKKALLILDKTPFYAEMGGQCGDRGKLSSQNLSLDVIDTIKWNDMVIHKVESRDEINSSYLSEIFEAEVDSSRRSAIKRNHSATHLLQAALESVLGDHIEQSGSRVDENSFRFDFTHFSALTAEELRSVETLVNSWVMEALPVESKVLPIDEAKACGAKALFGEKYGDSVRVVSMGSKSMELCGGTHVANTGEIGPVLLLSEASVSAGVRRVEAVAGAKALELIQKRSDMIKSIGRAFKTPEDSLLSKSEELLARVKQLENDLKAATTASAGADALSILDKAEAVGPLMVVVNSFGSCEKDQFSAITDALCDKIAEQRLTTTVCVIAADVDGKAMVAAVGGKEVPKTVRCGDIVKAIAPKIGGGGGGSPVRAQAGGTSPEGISEALQEAKAFISQKC